MGTRVSPSTDNPSGPAEEKFGDILYGRFSETSVDSVRAVRDLRERERE